MRNTYYNVAMTLVIALLSFTVISSCVDADYELSEERLNTQITLFQEGLSIPLGKTVPVTIGELYAKMDPEMKEILSNANGAYGIYYDGSFDFSDSLSSIKNLLALDKLDINESFSFNLSDVNLDGVEFERKSIEPDPVKIYTMLEGIPEFSLPEIRQSLAVSESIPSVSAESLELDFSRYNVVKTVEFASLGSGIEISEDLIKYIDWTDQEFTYKEMLQKVNETNDELSKIPGNDFRLPDFPDMKLAMGFDPVKVEFSIPISLPAQIESVNNIELNENANVEMFIKVENPLFTSGAIVPHLDLNLHSLFYIDNMSSGEFVDEEVNDGDGSAHIERHIKDNFTLDKLNGWTADHTYHVGALMIGKNDWIEKDGKLVLSKKFVVEVSGVIEDAGLKTTLNHLIENGKSPMQVVMQLKFNNFSIDNIEMEIEPIVIEKTITMPINVKNIVLPDLIEKIDYIALDQSEKLMLDMSASVPDGLGSLDLDLQSLEISFPEGLDVEHKDLQGDKISYENISLKEGLEDGITIKGINLPNPKNGTLSYEGNVNVTAKAEAGGIINTKDILGKEVGDIAVNVNVAYTPTLKDYNVIIKDYPYEVDIDPIVIKQTLPDEVGKMKEITVMLENDPVIKINLKYHDADGAIKIVADGDGQADGFKITFPEMIRFKNLDNSYGYDPKDNSINFAEGTTIPREISLPIDYLLIVPQPDKENQGKYCVEGQMTINGGVCLKRMTITKNIVDQLIDDKAEISIKAEIPTLKPAKLALDEYVASIEEVIDLDMIDFNELPDMVKKIEAVDLKEVYLNLEVDASSVVKLIDNVDMQMDIDVTLPQLIKVDGAADGNVISVTGRLDEQGKIIVDPVHVVGLNLDGIDFSQDNIDLGDQKIDIRGNVSLKNVSLDIDKLGDDDLQVAVAGSLCTKGKNTIEIDKVAAKVDYKIEPVNQTIPLTDFDKEIPENLDFNLDFCRFYLDVDIKTNISLPVEADFAVVPYYEGEPNMDKALLLGESLSLNYSESPEDTVYTKLRISNSEAFKVAGRKHIVLDILSLLNDMPDSLQLRFNAGTQENASFILHPTENYILKADYAFEMPLELGDDFKLEYADTLAIPSDFSTAMVDILSSGSFGLSGKVTNSLPIQLEMTANLLDPDGNQIGMTEGSGNQIIKCGNVDGSPVESDLNVIFGIEPSSRDQKISSIEVKFAVTSGGVTGSFRDNGFIQVELRALIPEGLTLDFKNINTAGKEEK